MLELASQIEQHQVTWGDAVWMLVGIGVVAVAVLAWAWAFASMLSIPDSEWLRIGRVQWRWVVGVVFLGPPLAVYYAVVIRPRLLGRPRKDLRFR